MVLQLPCNLKRTIMSVGSSMVHCFDPPLISNNQKKHRAKPSLRVPLWIAVPHKFDWKFPPNTIFSKSTTQVSIKRYIYQIKTSSFKNEVGGF